MATSPHLPASLAAPAPFLLSGAASSDFPQALREAVIAEARLGIARPDRCRIATLLCETGVRMAGPRSLEPGQIFPLSRPELATLLGIRLIRVKRALALFCLSGDIAIEGECLRVLDWRRLCSLGGNEQRMSACAGWSASEPETQAGDDREDVRFLTTAAGEPASFV